MVSPEPQRAAIVRGLAFAVPVLVCACAAAAAMRAKPIAADVLPVTLVCILFTAIMAFFTYHRGERDIAASAEAIPPPVRHARTNVVAAGRQTPAQIERQAETEHRVAQRLQGASLPVSLPSTREIALSATFRAGTREAEIGGDWYDALRLIDGRILLAIGEVLGGGLSAALATMALRQSMRGAAQTDADPVAILAAADRTLHEEHAGIAAGAFAAVFDPVTMMLSYACAGHAAPLLRRPGGEIVELAAPGSPLGTGRAGDTEARAVAIEPGAFLVLYTQGLIEAAHDPRIGGRTLRETLARVDPGRAGRAAEWVANGVLGAVAPCDAAVLTASFTPDAGDWSTERRWRFDATDRFSARAVQRAFCSALVAAGVDESLVAEAELVFAELVGNVVRHAPGPCDVVLDTDGDRPVLSILDRGRGYSRSGHLPEDELAEAGRGLFLVRSLTFDFRAALRPGGGTHARAVLAAQRPKAASPSPITRLPRAYREAV